MKVCPFFVSLIYSFYSAQIFRNKFGSNVRLLFLGPLLYALLSIYFLEIPLLFKLVNPIVLNFLFFTLGYKYPNQRSFEFSFLLIFSLFFISHYLEPLLSELRNEKNAFLQALTKKELKSENVNLDSFSFINLKKDTIKLSKTHKYIVLETWNESCKPCFEAIKHLKGFFESSKDSVKHYYLYIPSRNKINFEKLNQFKQIADKDKIIIDIDKKLFNKLDMSFFPVFLVFDQEGDLRDYLNGFDPKYTKEVEKEFKYSLHYINKTF